MPLPQYQISRHSVAALVSLAIITGLALAITVQALAAEAMAPASKLTAAALA